MDHDKVIYDERIPKIKQQKKRKSNFRLIVLIIIFFVVLAGVLYLQSPFSKLAEVNWQGLYIADEERLMQQAELKIGMSYFNFTAAGVESKLEQMDEIAEANVRRDLPNRLTIQVQEHPLVAFWLEEQALYPVLATGEILFAEPWDRNRVDQPILSGWPHKEGLIELSKELERLPQSVSKQISEIRLTPVVSDPYRLTLYMNDGYEVRTSIRRFAENMSWYPQIVTEAREEGKEEGIFYLLYGKWLEDPKKND